MARRFGEWLGPGDPTTRIMPLSCGLRVERVMVERVTRIELALSAWESVLNLPVRVLACGCH